jgi:hypothetical protein
MKPVSLPFFKTVLTAGCISLLLTAAVLLHYRSITAKAVVIVRSEDDAQAVAAKTSSESDRPNQFTVAPDTAWKNIKGNLYPYSFDAPVTLTLVTFPDDPYDIYAISWKGSSPDSNVLIGLDNLANNPSRSNFIKAPKMDYVREWWKQFGLKGVTSIEAFTNKKGLKGYKAKFFNSEGITANDDIFFEIPGHPEYVIHLASGVLSPFVFDRIVDSVAWTK